MKKLLFLAVALLLAASARAQSTSDTWIDITTVAPSGSKTDCSSSSPDWGTYINQAISNAPGNAVIFFPVGCYLISTQIQDAHASASSGMLGTYTKITYFGYGAELRASSSAPPSNSIIQFGNNSTPIRFRTIQGIYFNCNNEAIDGIDLDGLAYSRFDGITISQCTGSAAMRTVGTNGANYTNTVVGGNIYAPGPTTSGVLLQNGTNEWSFYGTQINAYNGGSSGVGIDLNGAAGGVFGVDTEGFATSIRVGYSAPSTDPNPGAEGITIAGNYIAGYGTGGPNNYVGILLGKQGAAGYSANGITITGNRILCNNSTSNDGIQIQQASGFSISGNKFWNCTNYAIDGYADGSNQGGDNGFVGANTFVGNGVSLLGSNNTVTNSVATKSANYTLNGADSWVNVTENTTITIPHSMTGQQWNVFNSGSGNVGLACDSGTINNEASIQLASQTGKTVTTDGTNCFAH